MREVKFTRKSIAGFEKALKEKYDLSARDVADAIDEYRSKSSYMFYDNILEEKCASPIVFTPNCEWDMLFCTIKMDKNGSLKSIACELWGS